jgi:hydrogenase maturation protease
MSRQASGALIIGYGNPLRTDDGVGPYVARALAARGYKAIDNAQLLPEMADLIAGFSRVIFVDCRADLKPGEIAVARVAARPGQAPDLHFTSTPELLLNLAKELYGAEPDAVLVGIGPASLEAGDRLSPAVEEAAEKAIEKIEEIAGPPGG